RAGEEVLQGAQHAGLPEVVAPADPPLRDGALPGLALRPLLRGAGARLRVRAPRAGGAVLDRADPAPWGAPRPVLAALFWVGRIRLVWAPHAQCFVNSICPLRPGVPMGEPTARNLPWLG